MNKPFQNTQRLLKRLCKHDLEYSGLSPNDTIDIHKGIEKCLFLIRKIRRESMYDGERQSNLKVDSLGAKSPAWNKTSAFVPVVEISSEIITLGESIEQSEITR